MRRIACLVLVCCLLLGNIVMPARAAEVIPQTEESNVVTPLATNSFNISVPANSKIRANTTATLKATALPLQQIIPGADCTSTVTVFVYDSNGDLLGTTSTNGDVDASATYTADGIVAEIECEYVFNGTHLGKYTLSVK